MKIPFHKPYITDDEVSEVVDSIWSGWLTMGPKTIEFEKRFREYIGSRYAVSMNSCTACLHLALKAIGLVKGDEVIVPIITFTATCEVITYFNAKPIFVDVEKSTLNIDVSKIEQKITKKTKAIIPVHFAGQPCDMDAIKQIAESYKLKVIEDAAHAIPAWYLSKERDDRSKVIDVKEKDKEVEKEKLGVRSKGKMIGTIGDITCFSFYATKTLSTGEGGMVTTDNEEWADEMRMLRLHGISKDAWKRYSNEGSWYYEVMEAGYKYNMTDIQAALGLAQLKKVEWMWEKRKEIARKYTKAFKSIKEIITPYIKPDRESAWHLYIVKLNLEMLIINRNQFIEELKKRGIGTSVHFIPLYIHPFYRDTFGCNSEDFPSSEWLYERIISLPIYPGMTDEDVEMVVEAVGDVVRRYRR